MRAEFRGDRAEYVPATLRIDADEDYLKILFEDPAPTLLCRDSMRASDARLCGKRSKTVSNQSRGARIDCKIGRRAIGESYRPRGS